MIDHFSVFSVISVVRDFRHRARRANEGIIRNRLTIDAAIENAKRLVAIGSFSKWLDAHRGLSKEEWVKLFKKTFVFHRRQDHQLISDQHRRSARSARRELRGVQADFEVA